MSKISLIDALKQRATLHGAGPDAVLLRKAVAELERLTTDADRYRWLRSRDLDTIAKGGVFAGKTPQNVVLNEDDLDRAVDEARAL